jgi:coenzyme F420 hydrogenase subunit beta
MKVKNKKPLIAYNDLKSRIINPGFCTLCGACEAACPVHALKVEADKPHYIFDCSTTMDLCPICYDICPHSDALSLEATGFVADAPFRRESLGYYRKVLLAQSVEPRLRELSHSGGVVTSLLTYAIDKDIIDSAIVSEAEPNIPVKPKPLVGLVPDDVLSSVDSKFFPAAVAKAFGSAVYEYGKVNVAFVGIPCHVLALRKLEAWQHKLIGSLKITIGLFCLWTLSMNNLLRYLSRTYKVKVSEIQRIDLTKEYLIQTAKKTLKIPLSEIKTQVLPSCRTCTDFTAELADISVGSAYPLKDWSTVIVRTKSGENLLNNAVEEGVLKTRKTDEEQDVFAHTIEMALHKRKFAFEEIKKMKAAKKLIPPARDRLVGFLPTEMAFLANVRVQNGMTKKVETITPNLTVNEMFDIMTRLHHMGYPVVDEDNKLIGIVTFEDITKVPKKKRDKVLVGDICRKKLIKIYPEESVLDAFRKMEEHNIGRILVVDRKDPTKLLGILTKHDVMHVLTFWRSI